MSYHKQSLIERLLSSLGGNFSASLGIDVSKEQDEIFKWFLASILFGARISEKVVVNTYRKFERYNILTPDKILETGWDLLVEILDEGGYARYDYKTATKLLEVMDMLGAKYGGDLSNLHKAAQSHQDLEERLLEFKGIGPATVNIFLRELREVWDKAEPLPAELVIIAASNLGLTEFKGKNNEEKKKILQDLKRIWKGYGAPKAKFSDFESSLLRLAKDYCRKGKHDDCPVGEYCLSRPLW
jgi:endonuclease III